MNTDLNLGIDLSVSIALNPSGPELSEAQSHGIRGMQPSGETHQIAVHNLIVDVVRKSIKNLHLGVYPPHGRVRVAAPLAVSDDAVRRAVIGKLGWIKRQQTKFWAQPRQSKREMISGESHYFLGRRYRLQVVPCTGAARIQLHKSRIELYVPPQATTEDRLKVLDRWYRARLKEQIPPLLNKWQPIIGVQADAWGVRKMKTKWGTCNAQARRIWLNLELIKKPELCLEYLVVHELVHLRERTHSDRFESFMDQFLPQWRLYRAELNQAPLNHEDWGSSLNRM